MIDLPPALESLTSGYGFVEELGRGGMAVVYRARDRQLGREVAIKVLRPGMGSDAEAVSRLEREAKIAARLEHPNIVPLYRIHRLDRGMLALVMRYVRGATLKEELDRSGAFSFGRTRRVLIDVAEALDYAHRRGIVHRDVKPENIFLEEDSGRALLADFGIARAMESAGHLTQTGTSIGTPHYMSPEAIEGGEVDGRSDLYSLGLVGWEMLTGEQPWAGESLYSVIVKQRSEELPSLMNRRPDVPRSLFEAVHRATAKDPAERWTNAESMRLHSAGSMDQSEPWSSNNPFSKGRELSGDSLTVPLRAPLRSSKEDLSDSHVSTPPPTAHPVHSVRSDSDIGEAVLKDVVITTVFICGAILIMIGIYGEVHNTYYSKLAVIVGIISIYSASKISKSK